MFIPTGNHLSQELLGKHRTPAMSVSSAQRVLVSYSVSPTFIASQNWNKVYAALVAQLPLRNIHRKSPSKQSVKTIQELDVTLVSLDTVSEEPTSQVPSTLLEKPLLHIFILHCEVIQLLFIPHCLTEGIS